MVTLHCVIPGIRRPTCVILMVADALVPYADNRKPTGDHHTDSTVSAVPYLPLRNIYCIAAIKQIMHLRGLEGMNLQVSLLVSITSTSHGDSTLCITLRIAKLQLRYLINIPSQTLRAEPAIRRSVLVKCSQNYLSGMSLRTENIFVTMPTLSSLAAPQLGCHNDN